MLARKSTRKHTYGGQLECKGMEVKSILRRTQSLRSVHTERTLSVTEVGLRDRKKSVSELVAEYRFTSKGKAPISEHEKQENTPAFVPPVLAPAPVPEPTVDPEVESPVAKVRNSIVRERSRSLSERQPQPLSRAKSMESLPRGTGAPGGTSALKALFESKVMTPRELKHGGKSPLNSLRVSRDAQVKAEAEEVVEKVNEVKKNNSHDPPPLMSQAEEATPKVVRRSRPERRQTVSGVYLDRTSQTSDDKEKRRSLADFGWEKSSISVKAISALFQSKAAAVETSGNQGMDSFSPSGKRPKGIKMTEDSQASKSDLSETHLTDDPLQFAAKRPQAHSANMTQNPMRPCLSPTPPSKEAFSALYQQRQKCELKRLLKHTCPELKSLDGVVDEELADVLRSESTAEDTGYQGEVLSRRWIFENCAFENVGDPNDSKTHLEGEGHEELEIKGFFPLQETTEEQMEISSLEEADEEVKGDVKGTIKSLLANAQDKMGPGPRKVEESERGNVELFRKCIEKGDLEYLKSLQKTPSEEELNSAEEAKSPIMEDNATESISGNVKNIKNIFSCQGLISYQSK
ncbi:hypothetical protein AALO_G00213950 [Alosa alosa]|uniref:Uncharacterized protein n=1 Tax=Alosa alosa TaxID=278164 RepID=A0AAV6G0D3_9TELE|nr:hypothetical protein AALO_G00213950 [Alosa alosa]